MVANRFTGRTQVRVRCVCAPGGLGMSRKPGPAAVVPIRRPHGPDWAYPTDSACPLRGIRRAGTMAGRN